MNGKQIWHQDLLSPILIPGRSQGGRGHGEVGLGVLWVKLTVIPSTFPPQSPCGSRLTFLLRVSSLDLTTQLLKGQHECLLLEALPVSPCWRREP